MIFRLTTGVSAACCVTTTILFATSWHWFLETQINISRVQQYTIASARGHLTIQDIVLSEQADWVDDPTPEEAEITLLERAQSIDQKVRDGEVEVFVIQPLPWYDFLLFDVGSFEDIPPSSGFQSLSWVAIPYWAIIVVTGILPTLWFFRYRGTRRGKSAG